MPLTPRQNNLAAVGFGIGAKIEPLQTRSEDVPQNAVAGRFAVAVHARHQACAFALRTSHVGQANRN
jgi:hypothetical protein